MAIESKINLTLYSESLLLYFKKHVKTISKNVNMANPKKNDLKKLQRPIHHISDPEI